MHLSRRDTFAFCLLVTLVLLSRAPFLTAGYGTQMDAWRVANTARYISETGSYQVSRFPGFPVHEIICSFLWKGGPLALNGASAVFGVIAVTLFALIGRSLGLKHWLLASLALAFTPVFYINSVSSKDYTWALAFTLASLFFVLKKRPALAGIFLGIATGCRITSCVAGLPLLVILAGSDQARAVRRVIIFAAVSSFAAMIMFAPVIVRYGTEFFTTYYHDYPDWHTILTRSTTEVWGWTGTAGLCVALGGIVWKSIYPATPTALCCAAYHVAGFATAIAIYLMVYFPHPDLAGYLIPVLPFAILLLAQFTARRCFQAFCALTIAGAFVTLDDGKVVAGEIFQDHAERIRTAASVGNFISDTERMSGRNVFVVGGFEPIIENWFLDLKTQDGMYSMKTDMGGGAAVLGAMQAIAAIKPNVRVIGIMAAAENMPSGTAMRPSDVVTALNGKTFEIGNTDAEGRMVLADAVTHAARAGADEIIDLATLTGAKMVALGNVAVAVMGNNQELTDRFLAAASHAGERVWQLPTWDEYKEALKSDIADIKSTGGRGGGAITAALFIGEFVEGTPWIHLDIAGSAATAESGPYTPKGATGVMVRSLVQYVEEAGRG